MVIGRLCCVDPRQPKDGVFNWSTAGAVLPDGMVDNICTVIDRIERFEVITHTDCLYRRIALGLDNKTSLDESEIALVEEQSALSRREVARELLHDGRFRKAVLAGMELALGHHDVTTQTTEWNEIELANLLADF